MEIPAFNGISMQIYSAFFEHTFEKYKKNAIYQFLYKNYAKARENFVKSNNRSKKSPYLCLCFGISFAIKRIVKPKTQVKI